MNESTTPKLLLTSSGLSDIAHEKELIKLLRTVPRLQHVKNDVDIVRQTRLVFIMDAKFADAAAFRQWEQRGAHIYRIESPWVPPWLARMLLPYPGPFGCVALADLNERVEHASAVCVRDLPRYEAGATAWMDIINADIIWVFGGKISRLIESFGTREAPGKAPSWLQMHLDKGGIYVGVSAGTIIAGKSLSLKLARDMVSSLSAEESLGLCQVDIEPHGTRQSARLLLDEIRQGTYVPPNDYRHLRDGGLQLPLWPAAPVCNVLVFCGTQSFEAPAAEGDSLLRAYTRQGSFSGVNVDVQTAWNMGGDPTTARTISAARRATITMECFRALIRFAPIKAQALLAITFLLLLHWLLRTVLWRLLAYAYSLAI